MALFEIIQKIIDKSEYDISPIRGFFGLNKGKKIKLKAKATQELFSDIFQKICKILGSPIYVHTYYGYMWEKNGEFLSYNIIEEYYQDETIDFFLFNRFPSGKKLNYQDYIQKVETIKQVFADHNLACNDYINYFDNGLIFLGNNNETQCLILIKRRSLFFYYSQKEPLENGMTKLIPCYTRKKRIVFSDTVTIKRAAENCFAEE